MCKPRHAAMMESTSPRFEANQFGGTPSVASVDLDGTEPVPPVEIFSLSALRSSNNFGMDGAGSAGRNVARSCFTFSAIASDFETRDHVVSTPSNNSLVIGAPSSTLKYSFRAPRLGGLPTPWLLCMLRLAAAISVKALPRSGLKPPASIVARPVGSNGKFRFEKKNGDVFQTSRVGFQTSTKESCSGKRFGSPAA